MRNRTRYVAYALTAALTLTAAACKSSGTSGAGGGGNSSSSSGATASGAAQGSDPFAIAKGAPTGAPGAATLPQWQGTPSIPAHEPDSNGDGTVTLGIITSGDTNDGTYYESVVTAADYAAKKYGWKVSVQDKVPVTQALSAAEDLCRQKVDMVIIGDGQLAQGANAAKEAVCKGTFFYLQSGFGAPKQDGTFTQSLDIGLGYNYVAGVAAGTYMKANNIKKAGFIAGLAAPFNTSVGTVFSKGVQAADPGAQVVTTYTGDQIDVGKAVIAFNAQKSQGIGLVYPYFGAPTLAVARQANAAKIPVLGSPDAFCDSTSPAFIGSVVFAPGYYLAPLLDMFATDKLPLGVTRNWRLGIDAVPLVQSCTGAGAAASAMDSAIKKAEADINSGAIDPVKLGTGS